MLSARFSEAMVLAATLHANDRRKGTTIPYVSHLLGVCSLVLNDGGDEDEAIAALLHDALEDHGDAVTASELGARFGARVRDLVVSCTDTPAEFTGGEKPPWRGRKEQYLAHVRESRAEDLRVSLADKLYNARAMVDDVERFGDDVWERFKAGKRDQIWYYTSLLDAYRAGGMRGSMFDEFARIVGVLSRI